MKVIVDTCVWSLSLRRMDQSRLSPGELHMIQQLREAIQDRRAVILGPIRQEILSGIRDKMRFDKVRRLLEPFQDAEIVGADYVEAAKLFNFCQDHGVACGAVDILLCAVAVRLKYGILTNDQGLTRCVEVLRADGLIA